MGGRREGSGDVGATDETYVYDRSTADLGWEFAGKLSVER